MTSVFVFTWLVNSALASMVLLMCGAVAVAVSRQPADRLRLIQWTLVATLMSIVLVNVPTLSALSWAILIPSEHALNTAPTTVGATLLNMPPPSSSVLRPKDSTTAVHNATAADQRPSMSSPSVNEHVQPAAAHNQIPLRQTNFMLLAIRAVYVAYIAGMMVFLVRWTLARIRLRHILRNASDVPATIHAELSQITGSRSSHVLLLASTDVAGPIMWGTRRPVIVLPSSVLREQDRSRLRYYLAHEWAHVKRGDYKVWQLASLLQFFLYYQPLFWWMRRRLATSMDQLADAAASDQGASAADYAAFLVELARRQLALPPRLTLSINDKQSPLRQRVMFLLNAAAPPKPTCPRARSLAIAVTAILLGALVSAVRLDAQPAENSSGAKAEFSDATTPLATRFSQQQSPIPANDEKVTSSITYTGQVTDAITGEPIEGVKVNVIRKLSRDPETGGWRELETTQHETDADGRYSFVIPPEQAGEESLYLEVEARHPNYASKGRSGYSHAMIRKNLAMGEQPFYSQIKLWPGEAVTATVVSPKGEPLADVEISMYSASDQSTSFLRGSFDKTKTDAKGVFRIVPPTPGDGVLWIKPEQYSPQAHRIGDRRGDWGTLTMQKGATLSGQILDAQGAPVAGVKIKARRRGDGEKSDEFLNTNAVANQIGREAVTGATGEFTLASLPDGDYSLQVASVSDSYDPPPLKQVFLRKNVSIAGGSAPEALEIRAVPHVVIKATVLNSAGKPRSGHELTLFGRMDGNFYAEQSSVPGNDGKLEVKVPHGLQQVELDLHTNEHSSLRWRMSHDAPLRRGRRIKLGTIEDDITGIGIIRYTAPIVLVKPVDEHGTPVEDCTPVIKYVRSDQDEEEMTVYTTGSHVSFEHQQDGRWRSSQALPDEPMAVRVEKAGYTTMPQEVTLSEGEERELVFVMKEAAAKEAPGDE